MSSSSSASHKSGGGGHGGGGGHKRTYNKPKDGSGSFFRFQQICDKIGAVSGYNDKTDLLKEFFSVFDGDLFIFCRLMLCREDKRVYRLREKSMAKLMSKYLRCDVSDLVEDLENGDVAETCAKFFEKEGEPKKFSTLSLKQVDDLLESLTKSGKEDEQLAVLRPIFDNCTVEDVRYIAKLIDHDLNINIGAKYVLGALHSDAYEQYKHSNNLSKVIKAIQELKEKGGGFKHHSSKVKPIVKKKKDDEDDAPSPWDGDFSDDDDFKGPKSKSSKLDVKPLLQKKLLVGLSILSPIKPCLAAAAKGLEVPFKKHPEGVYGEIKYDGERIQIHKHKDNLKCYSRNLKEVLPFKVEAVEEYIPKSTKASSVILDGEILLMDTNTHKPLPFGTLAIHKKSKFKDATVCVFLFDVLYLDGKQLLDEPFEKRRKILEKIVTVVPNRVELSDCRKIEDQDDLKDMMGEVLMNDLEGLVLKGKNTTYSPGKRKWLKLKKDYLKGMADTADLVVLGAYFGTGKFGSLMSVFLMGCFDNQEKVWKTVCKVGTGFDDSEINDLQQSLKVVKISQDYSKVPKWLDVSKSLTPDFVVADPWKAPVWEIMGAGFSESNTHTAAGISIRFPRMKRVRDDKSWKTHTNLKELLKLSKIKPGKALLDTLNNLGGKKYKSSSSSTSSKGKSAASDSSEEDNGDTGNPSSSRKKTFFDDDDGATLSAKSSSSSKTKVQPGEKRRRSDDSDNEDEDDERSKKNTKASQAKKVKPSSPPVINIKYIPKSVTTPVDTDSRGSVIVLNIVDDSGRWPSDSVSVEIAKKWPEVKPDLKSSFSRKADSGLGDVRIIKNKHDKLKVFVCLLVSRSHETMEIDPRALKEGLKTVSLLAKMKSATVHVSNLTLASTNIEWDQMEGLLGKLFADKKVFVYTGVIPGIDEPVPPSSSKKNVTSSSSSSSTTSSSKKTQSDPKKSVDPDATQEMEVEDEGPPTPRTSSASSSSNNKSRKNDSEEEEKNASPPKKSTETKKGSISSAGALEGTRVYFHGKLETVQNLDNMKRHVYYHNGEVCDTFDELTTHVVGDSWDSCFYEFAQENSRVHFVSPSWVRICCKTKERHEEEPYRLKKRSAGSSQRKD